MKHTLTDRILISLTAIYGEAQALATWSELEETLGKFRSAHPKLCQSSALENLISLNSLLITYADQIQSPGIPPLQSLTDFIEGRLKDLISGVHLLPFFPYSSDDGFSVIDYTTVDPAVGSWSDLERLQSCCQLMFDLVINHTSSKNAWFQGFLQGRAPYQDYYLTVDPGVDLSGVIRPRATPLLTAFNAKDGERYVWTTFSPDQIDLNFRNPDVLVECIKILLLYIDKGASIIRLDAIAYLWKQIGTPCIHLPQTHQVIKLLRAVLDYAAPGVILITETNVPHQENISYFGAQLPKSSAEYPLGDEAQMVYQFPLAPLVLHTFRVENSQALSRWASSIEVPFASATFLNFIASHDGIGVRPAEGLLSNEEIQGLVEQTLNHNGNVSYKTNQDGSQSVYELNITLYDALNHPQKTSLETGLKRFLASQAIMLSLAGIPGIYVHSLLGSSNSIESIQETGRARSINRGKFTVSQLDQELNDPHSRTSRIFAGYTHLLSVRKEHSAFKPLAPQQILDLDHRVFAVLRTAKDGRESILCLINISHESVQLDSMGVYDKHGSERVDLLTGTIYPFGRISLDPYQIIWLKL